MEQKPNLRISIKKFKSKIKILNTIAIIFLLIQLWAYIITMKKINVNSTDNSIGFYIGFNLWIIISIFLFVRANAIQNKLDEIEKNETTNTQN